MTDSDRDVIYNRLANVMTRDKDISYSDDQVAPDRVDSSAAEGGASAGGGFGVGLGVVDSRLPLRCVLWFHTHTVNVAPAAVNTSE